MYLEVKIGTDLEYPNLTAFTANGHDLGDPQGCFGSLFLRKPFPLAEDYFQALQYEGWKLYHIGGSVVRSAMVMQGGWVMGNRSETRSVIFIGNGRYKVRWERKNGEIRWYLTQ